MPFGNVYELWKYTHVLFFIIDVFGEVSIVSLKNNWLAWHVWLWDGKDVGLDLPPHMHVHNFERLNFHLHKMFLLLIFTLVN